MAVDPGFNIHLLELLQDFGEVSARRMFGGFGIFRDGLMFGLVADEVFYLKVDDQNRPDFEARGLEPFQYEKQGKLQTMSYYQAPEEVLDNAEEMICWATGSFNAALRANAGK